MEWKIILSVIFGAILCVGSAEFSYQIYQITMIDARSRNLKHPKFWGLFAMNTNNSNGLIMYLIGRRKYPVKNINTYDRSEIERRKKCAGAGLIFLAAGAVGLILSLMV